MKINCTILFLNNNCKISPQHYYTENLGIQYIGAVLRQHDYNTLLINADFFNKSNSEIVNEILGFNTGFLGMAPSFINMKDAIEIAKEIKRIKPNIKICLGGHHATFCANDILDNEPSIDLIIRGEGEYTIIELLEVLENNEGNYDSYRKIMGLSFKYDGQIFHNQDRPLIEDLDSIPFPVRDFLETTKEINLHSMPLLSTSRGCLGNCSFCTTPKFFRRKWRNRNAKSVVDEIEMLINEYGTTQFYVTDDQFAGVGEIGKKHILDIMQEIKKRKLNEQNDLHFFLMIRADFFNEENEYIIKQFPDVGFNDIFIGFESNDKSQLELYSKGCIDDTNYKALNILRKYNLFVEGGFILFNPYSTISTIKKDTDFIRDLGVPLFSYYTKELMVYPGTRLFDKLLSENLLLKHSYKEIEFSYREPKVKQLHTNIKEFFSRFEKFDNNVFESIDFQIKLPRFIKRIKDKELKTNAEKFIELSSHAFAELNLLNFNFFMKCINTININRNSEQEFFEKHEEIFFPVYEIYLKLNNLLKIIKV